MKSQSGIVESPLPVGLSKSFRESERLYRQLVECLPMAIYMCDAAGRVTLFNRAATELWGREPVLGQDLWCGSWRIYRPDGTPLPLDQCPMAKSLREGRAVLGEEIIIERPDGSRRNVMPHPEPLRDSAGQLIGSVNMLVDITEQKRGEEAKALLAAIVESSRDAIISITLEGNITSWNAGAERIFGYTEDEVVGRSITMLIPEDHENVEEDILNQLRLGKRVEHCETVRLHKDGTRIDISLAISPIRNEAGHIIGASKVARDVTRKILAESALRDSEERFRTLSVNAPVAIFIKDLEGRYTLANPLACEALGRPDGVTGLTDHDLLPEGVADLLRQRDLEVISTGCAGERMEVVERDGFHRDYLSVKFPLFDAEGTTIGVCGVSTDITDRKRDQESLRQSEERFARFMQHLPGLAWIKDISGKYVYANDAASNAFQIPSNELYGKTDDEIFSPETAAQFQDNDQRALASEAGIQSVETLEQGDGVLHYSYVNKFPIPGPDGTPTLVGGMAIDITDQKRAEVELIRTQEQLRLVTDTMAVAVARCTSDHRYQWVSPGCTTLLKKSQEEIIGRTIREVIGDSAYSTVRPYIERVLAGERVEYEAYLDYQSIGPRWVRASYVPTYSDAATPDGWVAVVIDITEEKHREEALRTSEQLYRAIGESNNYGVWICDPEGRNIYTSESFLKLVGLSQDECSNLGWTSVLHPDDIEETSNAWKKCVSTGGAWDREHRFRGADGAWHMILARGVPVKSDSGEITAWAGINLDISQLKRVEHELREADRRKDEFLAVLAHELRNPLAPIRSGLELMRLAGDDRELFNEVHTTMERQTQIMVRLIDDLLDVSRITRGTIELRKSRVDLASVIQNAVETARPSMDDLGHRLSVVLPNRPIVLEADPTRLAQVISNLLNNSAKYTQPGGNIELVAERHDEEVVVTVRDSGIGIPSDMLKRIFEMFAQVDRSRERSSSGLGIGLTLVKRLIEMHGGTVEAHSAGPGKGSEFVIRLPIHVGPLQRMLPTDGQTAATSAAHRILVADDNEQAARILAMLLTALGNDVRVAHDGQAALEVAAEFHPDIIFLDLGMPKLDGYETARQIREQPWGKSVVLAALTGWGQEEDKRRTKEVGFNHHLVKPVEPSTLQMLLAD
jgi:PAS domain S-box-containing protein